MHQLVLMRCTTGYGARVKVILIFGETILVYPKILGLYTYLVDAITRERLTKCCLR